MKEVFEEWEGLVDMINFQFHTTFSHDDGLWIPFGSKRDAIIQKIKRLKRKYPYKSYNTDKQLDLLGTNKWTEDCPNWAFLSLDHKGERKKPCFIGSSDSGKNRYAKDVGCAKPPACSLDSFREIKNGSRSENV